MTVPTPSRAMVLGDDKLHGGPAETGRAPAPGDVAVPGTSLNGQVTGGEGLPGQPDASPSTAAGGCESPAATFADPAAPPAAGQLAGESADGDAAAGALSTRCGSPATPSTGDTP